MNRKTTVTILVALIILTGALASSCGIFSKDGPGPFQYQSIRGQTVDIYGRGIYRHMPADVAIQGIAQDFITLFIGIPLLLITLPGYRKKSARAHFLLSGTLGYFLVTYLFYTAMAMYNILFLAYAALLGLSFFALFLTLKEFDPASVSRYFSHKAPVKFTGCFLIFNSIIIALLWLSVVLPPLLNGTIYPDDLHHFTTLIVQGFDLGLLLPISFIVGLMLMKNKATGYLFGTPYIIFLSILMTALTAKIIAMAVNGVNVVPAVFIIPVINLVTIACAFLMVREIRSPQEDAAPA